MKINGSYDFTKYDYAFDLYSSNNIFSVRMPFNFLRNKVSSLPYPHQHTYYEFIYAEHKNRRQPAILQLIPPSVEHMTYSEPNCDDLICYTFDITVYPNHGPQTFKGYPLDVLDAITKLSESVTMPDTINACDRFHAVVAELRRMRQSSAEKIGTELQLLLVDFARCLPGADMRCSVYMRAFDTLRAKITEFFLVDYAPFSASRKEELADLLHVSTRQLSRILMQTYGKSYRSLLLERRMEFARGHAAQHTPEAKAAEACGYTSTASFQNAYRKYWGVSYPAID